MSANFWQCSRREWQSPLESCHREHNFICICQKKGRRQREISMMQYEAFNIDKEGKWKLRGYNNNTMVEVPTTDKNSTKLCDHVASPLSSKAAGNLRNCPEI